MEAGDSPRFLAEKVLIVTADDFGYCPERNRGILESYTTGIITRASLLVNGAAAMDACAISRKFNLPMGLHLNLTEGIQVLKPESPSSLVTQDGHFFNRYQLLEAIQKEEINENDIYLEIISQINMFQTLNNGQLPYYVDGHQHIHIFPVVRNAFCKALSDCNIKETRLPLEILENCDWSDKIQNMAYLKSVAEESFIAKKLFIEHSIKFPDRFIGMTTMSDNMSEDRIKQLLKVVYKRSDITSTVVCEMMTHPGYPCSDPEGGGCGTGADDFAQSDGRRHELKVLVNRTLHLFLENEKIKMATTCCFY